jgi:hypothetical protein
MQRAELERMRQRHAAQAAEVAAVEAEEGEITARNQALNKQAAAMQTEVCHAIMVWLCWAHVCMSLMLSHAAPGCIECWLTRAGQ